MWSPAGSENHTTSASYYYSPTSSGGGGDTAASYYNQHPTTSYYYYPPQDAVPLQNSVNYEFNPAQPPPPPPAVETGLQPLQNLALSEYPPVPTYHPTSYYQYDLNSDASPFSVVNGDAFLGQVESQPSLHGEPPVNNDFEKSLITNEPSYQQDHLDDYWAESGVSNWLTFGQGVPLEGQVATPPEDTHAPQQQPIFPSFYSPSTEFLNHDEDSAPAAPADEDVDDEEEDEEDDDDEYISEVDEPPQQQTQEEETVAPSPRQKDLWKHRPCPLCPSLPNFKSPKLFETHMKSAHNISQPYECTECGSKFTLSYQLKAHMSIHDPNRFTGEPQFKCDHCPKAYYVKVSLYAHHKQHHPGKKPGFMCKTPKGRRPKDTCRKLFQTPQAPPPSKKKHKIPRRHSFSTIPEPPPPPRAKIKSKKPRKSQDPPAPPPPPPPPPPLPVEISSTGRHVCPYCSKIFAIPSSLRLHMMLHTGEKPFPCDQCPARFRLKQTLIYHVLRNHRTKGHKLNILKWNKCRVCGKPDFVMFHELHNHRIRKHAGIKYEKELEKPFGCGICGKPFFLREEAISCALWAHKPDQILQQMFRLKCKYCPADKLGFCSVAYLHKHVEEEHPGKKWGKGKISGENETGDDKLPVVRMSKRNTQEMREYGLPVDTSFDVPLYVDLTQFPATEMEQHLMAEVVLNCLKKGRGREGHQVCTLCGVEVGSRKELGIHLRKTHVSRRLRKEAKEEKTEETVENKAEGEEEEKQVQLQEEEEENTLKCKFCSKTFAKSRMLQFHEARVHLNPRREERKPPQTKKQKMEVVQRMIKKEVVQRKHKEEEKWEVYGRVNLRNNRKVKKMLNFQSVFVKLVRCDGGKAPATPVHRRRSSAAIKPEVVVKVNKTWKERKTEMRERGIRQKQLNGMKRGRGRPRKYPRKELPPEVPVKKAQSKILANINKPQDEVTSQVTRSTKNPRRNSCTTAPTPISPVPEDSQAALPPKTPQITSTTAPPPQTINKPTPKPFIPSPAKLFQSLAKVLPLGVVNPLKSPTQPPTEKPPPLSKPPKTEDLVGKPRVVVPLAIPKIVLRK